jgi:signal transduction histidine kinase/CheY-like chemotaxis protein
MPEESTKPVCQPECVPGLDGPLAHLKELLEDWPSQSAEDRESAVVDAFQTLETIATDRKALTRLNSRLAEVSAQSAELFAELEEKNRALSRTHHEVAKANAYAAELMAEVELKNQRIGELNGALAHANAQAAELVAELELLTSELTQANKELHEAIKEKSTLLGFAAHDLRGGIGIIKGMAEFLRDGLGEEVDEDSREFADMISDESLRLLKLLTELLDVSRIEQGRIQLNRHEIQLGDLLEDTVRFHAKGAETKNQALKLELPGEDPVLSVDPDRVRQILDNLISNAIKYSRLDSEIVVRLWADEDHAGVSVHDAGPGIKEDELPKLFRPFQRLSAKPTGGEDSHGLGLAVARKIVDLHFGRIWVENQETGGAVFSFALPRHEARPRSRHVLLVEGNESHRLLVETLLAKGGHQSHSTASGEECLELLGKEPCDIVLMDVQVPGVDGYETTRRLRKSDGPNRDVPVVALSACGNREHNEKAFASGMNATLEKPVDPHLLEAAIHRWDQEESTP